MARRHAIAPQHRVADAEAATRAMTVLHATEPSGPYLSVAARVDVATRTNFEQDLYERRSLVKQLAMRRTLFVFPRDLLPAAWGSASRRVAAQIGARLEKDVEEHGVAVDGRAWLARARVAVLDRLADYSELSAVQLRREVPELQGRITVSADKSYGGEFPVAPRVLTQLAVEAKLVRGRNGGHWRISKPQWTLMEGWLREAPSFLPEVEGFAELVRRYLRTFGPATERDLVWWLGATKGIVRSALVANEAVSVALERDQVGWVLPDDLDPEPEVAPWAALLPTLDPTTMGWKDRDFYLDPPDVPYLFDSVGNAGTTAWWNGQIVGAYVQAPSGRVEVILRRDPGPQARAALDVQARRLTEWMDGEVVANVYKSALMKREALP